MFKNKEEFKQAFLEKLHTLYGECLDEASDLDKYNALGSMIRDHIAKYWTQTNKQYRKKK